MNIIIEDIQKETSVHGTYVATFPSAVHTPFTSYKYPVQTDPNNAEQILHVLNAMCHHPEVYGYLKAHIPSPFFPDKKVRNRNIPLEPLLYYLAGPSKMHCLDWNEDNIEYSKSGCGLAVRQYNKGYTFSYSKPFTTAFIESFGAAQWEDTFYKQALTQWEFCNAAQNVAACLSPFETWFVTNPAYEKLCHDLRNICIRLEAIVEQTFFVWQAETNRELLLVNIIKETSPFNYKPRC